MATNDATAACEANKDGDVTECPVCREWYRDPRLLHCGHHFCLPCLQKVAEGHPQGAVMCPTCRHVTEGKVGDLSKFKVNEFTMKVTSFLERETPAVKKPCFYCGEQQPAAWSCLACLVSFCEGCRGRHKPLEPLPGHQPAPLTHFIFCAAHPDRFIRGMCAQCHMGCCVTCAVQHEGHVIEDVHQSAERTRKRLKTDIVDKVSVEEDDAAIRLVKVTLKTLRESSGKIKDYITRFRAHIADVTEKLDALECVADEKIKSEIKDLAILERDMEEFKNTKVELLKTVTALTASRSDPEVLLRAAQLPKYASDSIFHYVDKESTCIPDFNLLEKAVDKLLDISQNIPDLVTFVDTPLFNVPLNYSLLQKYFEKQAEVGWYGLMGITWNDTDGTLVCRSELKTARVQVYNRHLELVTSLAILGEEDGFFPNHDVCLDSALQLYLLPMKKGTLVTVDKLGNVKDTIKVTDDNCCSVSCFDGKYFISSSYVKKQTLHCVDVTEDVNANVQRFSPNTKFHNPYHIISGEFPHAGQTIPVVYVSNNGSHCVKVIDAAGRHLHTYGTEGEAGCGPGQLSSPRGMCMDRAGRLLLCDGGNHRVVALWREGGEDKMELVLDRKEIGEQTCHIAYDKMRRRLFVGCRSGTIKIFSE